MDANNGKHVREGANWSFALRRLISSLLLSPLYIALFLIANGLKILRPLSPQLIPLLVCLLLIPFVFLLSASAGWAVWKNAAVNWKSEMNLQYGDGVPPYAYTPLPHLSSQQPYDISIDLMVPATESNLGLGNFMTTMTLLSSSNNRTITSVRRSVIITSPQSSWFFRTSDLIRIHIPLLPSFLPGTTSLTAFVEIGRKDGWRSLGHGEGRELSVLSATLKGDVVHYGVWGVISRFPFSSALVAGILFFGFLLLTIGLCLLPMVVSDSHRRIFGRPPALPVPQDNYPNSDTGVQPARRIKRPRTNRGEQLAEVKSKVSPLLIPSKSPKTSPSRHRPSRALATSDSDV